MRDMRHSDFHRTKFIKSAQLALNPLFLSPHPQFMLKPVERVNPCMILGGVGRDVSYIEIIHSRQPRF